MVVGSHLEVDSAKNIHVSGNGVKVNRFTNAGYIVELSTVNHSKLKFILKETDVLIEEDFSPTLWGIGPLVPIIPIGLVKPFVSDYVEDQILKVRAYPSKLPTGLVKSLKLSYMRDIETGEEFFPEIDYESLSYSLTLLFNWGKKVPKRLEYIIPSENSDGTATILFRKHFDVGVLFSIH